LVSSPTPLPSISTACGVPEGLSKSIVTVPDLASSDDLSNFREPSLGAASCSG
jgi:hypothetical protein